MILHIIAITVKLPKIKVKLTVTVKLPTITSYIIPAKNHSIKQVNTDICTIISSGKSWLKNSLKTYNGG